MTKIVINSNENGFHLSDEACERLCLPKRTVLGETFYDYSKYDWNENGSRAYPELVACVEELGDRVNAYGSDLQIVEIPDEVDWVIEDTGDGEWVAERHRKWFCIGETR